MKEKIEEKLQKNIERILDKEELTASDVAILKERLADIKFEENKEAQDAKNRELMSILMDNAGFANVR